MPGNRDKVAPEDLVELGRIVSAYGIMGWVKIAPHSAQAEVLLAAKGWWLKAPVPILGDAGASSHAQAARVLDCRTQGATLVAQLDLAPDRNGAEALKGYTVWVSRGLFPPSADDEYYWVDLIGCRLFGQSNGQSSLIGEVLEVIDNGAHAVLRVGRAVIGEQGALTFLPGSGGRALEVLVPFVRAHVQAVDILGKRIESDWPVEF
ncbi:MAG: ribosome maturation factor RimM [Candidimonas sp.]|nr:MAG: ribosome maturation factor RimM [Candidimonas sp.]TAM22954.1 MAG: ribosome maturation factor RimM [Candidimonas sp.]TAM77582.1 MAG: ribosome maturation factor RimM [Candidimonas sp.]